MRHHADWLERQGYTVDHVRIGQPEAASFDSALCAAIERNQPQSVSMIEAGEFGVQEEVAHACAGAGIPLELHGDTHFLCSREAFEPWRKGRKTLVMEHFYRHMRNTHDILMRDGCRYAPDKSTGDSACPFTTLYWDFLLRHEARFENHPRAAMQWRMLRRLDQKKRAEVRTQADCLRADLCGQRDN